MPEMPPAGQLPELGAPGAHPLFCGGVSGALSSQQLLAGDPLQEHPRRPKPGRHEFQVVPGRPERIGQLGLNHSASRDH